MQLLCLGDVAYVEESVTSRIWDCPGGMASGKSERILLNWELPVGDFINPVARSSGPRLLASQQALQTIRNWSPGYATLATNHILDASANGLLHTRNTLQEMGYQTIGAGQNREEIEREVIWETAEGRLAIINWVFPETHPDWMSIPGPNCWPGFDTAAKIIKKVRDQVDWILVVTHWSDEYFSYPRPEDRFIAGEIVRMGADIIIGHHPHVVRGMEIINTCPVFYSLGNYYFSDIPDQSGSWIVRQAPRNREGLGVLLLFNKGQRPEYRCLSFWKVAGKAVNDPFQRAKRRMELTSKPLLRYPNTQYSDWYKPERSRFDKWGFAYHFGFRQIGMRKLAKMVYARLIRIKTPKIMINT